LSENTLVFPPEADPPLEDKPGMRAESSENQTSEDFSPRKFIVDGKTGLFFDSQSQKALEDAILHSSKVKWDVSACRKNSLRFSKAVFVKDFNTAIADIMKYY
jgi:hypothetical protein